MVALVRERFERTDELKATLYNACAMLFSAFVFIAFVNMTLFTCNHTKTGISDGPYRNRQLYPGKTHLGIIDPNLRFMQAN